MAFEQTTADGYTISDDPARFDLPLAHRWISEESYWGKQIPYTTFATAIRNSLTFAAYGPGGAMAAMARVVTDRSTFGWLCDVFVDEAHRGKGLGKALVAYLKAHPDLQGFRRMHLATADAHELYRQFGFVDLTGADRWMEIKDDQVYRRGR